MGELVDRDEEQLRLLKLCYYILSVISGFYTLFPALIFAIFASVFSSAAIPMNRQLGSQVDARTFGVIILSFAAAVFAVGALNAFAMFLTGRSLGERRRRAFC